MLRILLMATAWLMLMSTPTAAQTTLPASFPVTPDPADCQVEPRPIEELGAVVGMPTASPASPTKSTTSSGTSSPLPASPLASATPFVAPRGEPADPETAEAVTATVYELFACTNAGAFMRVYALFTDDFTREFFAGTPLTEEVAAFLTAPPTPLPEDQRRIIVRFGEVQLLPDGRAGLVTVLDEPDDPRTEEPDYLFLEQVDGRWLVDEVVEDGGAAAAASSPTP